MICLTCHSPDADKVAEVSIQGVPKNHVYMYIVQVSLLSKCHENHGEAGINDRERKKKKKRILALPASTCMRLLIYRDQCFHQEFNIPRVTKPKSRNDLGHLAPTFDQKT